MSTIPTQAGRREWLAFAVLALPLLLVSMDVSILYFAVPQISRDLGSSQTEQLWIFDIYGFVLAGLLVTTGAIADRIGPRRLLLIGAVAFSATSLAAAYSQSSGQLIAARGLLGIAGATLMPSTLSMIRTLFHDPRQRGQAIGAWTGIMTAGVGLGPVVSGILLEHFWWGSVFLVNLPAMALLLVAGPLLLPRGETHERRFDLVSSALSLGAVLPAIYGIKEWAAHGWDVRWPACIAVGALLGWLFVRRQRRHVAPMIAPELMANPRYRIALFGNAICSFALIGNAVLITAYLQLVLGYGPLEAALWSLVPTVAVGSTAPFAAGLGQRFGMTRVAAAGLVVGAAGFGSWPPPAPTRWSSPWSAAACWPPASSPPCRCAASWCSARWSPTRPASARPSPRPPASWAALSGSPCWAASRLRGTERTPQTICRPTSRPARRVSRWPGRTPSRATQSSRWPARRTSTACTWPWSPPPPSLSSPPWGC